jgi:protein SCO1
MGMNCTRVTSPWLALLLALSPALVGAAPAAGGLAQLPRQWTDERGQDFDLASLRGRPVYLTMAYAGCHRFCPQTIAQLRLLQSQLDARGLQAQFVIVGFDPEHESSADWLEFRRTHQLNGDNWHFLTGSAADTGQFARQLGFHYWNYDEHVMHDTQVLVFDSNGVVQTSYRPGRRGRMALQQ